MANYSSLMARNLEQRAFAQAKLAFLNTIQQANRKGISDGDMRRILADFDTLRMDTTFQN